VDLVCGCFVGTRSTRSSPNQIQRTWQLEKNLNGLSGLRKNEGKLRGFCGGISECSDALVDRGPATLEKERLPAETA
jgi:hypothetical protein